MLKLGVPELDTPVPVRLTVEGEFPAVLVIDSIPVDAPTAVGANLTLSVILCPVVNVIGREYPEVTYGPVLVTAVTVIDPELVFEIDIVWAGLESLIVAVPRSKELGDTLRLSGPEGWTAFEPT